MSICVDETEKGLRFILVVGVLLSKEERQLMIDNRRNLREII